jgi:hypothetical protein
MVLYLFFRRRSRKLEKLHPVFEHQMGLFLLTGVLLLIFSMGYPFRIKLLWLLDAIPGIGQFRAVGRFAWIFYFIITVFSVRFISVYAHDLLLRRRKVYAYGLVFLGLGLYIAEGLPHHLEMRQKIVQSPNLFEADQLDAEMTEVLAVIEPGKYQAMLPLPYFHIGSEIFVQAGSDASMRWSQLISYHKKLPMMASLLGRSSLSQTKNLIKFVDWRIGNRPILNGFNQNKPILVMVDLNGASEDDKWFVAVSHGTELYRHENSALFEISPKDIAAGQQKAAFVERAEAEAGISFDSVGTTYTSVSNAEYRYRDFESNSVPNSFYGGGALSLSTPEGYTELLSFIPSGMDLNTEYIVSFWYQYKVDGFGPAVVVSQDDSYMETKVQFQPFTTEVKYGSILQGDWVLIELPVTLSSQEKSVHVAVCNIRNGHSDATIDNFLVRRADTHFLRNEYSYLWWNNYRMPK